MNAWSHLPNAAHIDAILADAKARPEVWGAAYYVARRAARHVVLAAAWDAARGAAPRAAWGAVWLAAWHEVRDTAQDAAQDAAWNSIRALIAWPESATLLDLTPDALRTIISTCGGDVKHQAVLLLPAVIARSTP